LEELVGSFGTFAVTWLTKHYEVKKARRERRIKTAFDYWKSAFEAAQAKGRDTVPGRHRQAARHCRPAKPQAIWPAVANTPRFVNDSVQ
jgi:hypothetical protein